MTAGSPLFLSDERRSAQQYNKLILALRKATGELRNLTADIDGLLIRLLPHLVEALEAADGYIFYHSKFQAAPDHFVLLSATRQLSQTTIHSTYLRTLADKNMALILHGAELASHPEVADLAIQNGIVAPLHTNELIYLLVIGNKQLESYPFLASDKTILEFLLSFIAAELRSDAQLIREHQAIQQISEFVTHEKAEYLWMLIVQSAALLSNAKYAQIYAFESSRRVLIAQCGWNASTEEPDHSYYELPLDGMSLNAHAAANEVAVYIADTTAEGDIPFNREKFEADVCTAYCVPLISQEELVGTLYIADVAPGKIAPDYRKAIDRLVPHAAIALYTARLIKQTNRNLELDEEIIAMQQRLADVLQEPVQIEQIYSVFDPYFPPESNLFLALWEESEQMIRLPIVHEQGIRINAETHKLYAPRKLKPGNGLIDYMYHNKVDKLDIADLDYWEDIEQIAKEHYQNLRSCLIVTLRHGDKLVGWLGFRGYAKTYMFTEYQRELLRRMAPHIATVLYNSHQYDQKVKEREVVSRFQTAISNLSNSEAAEIAQISTEIQKALIGLGLYAGDMYLALYDEVTDDFHVPVVHLQGAPIADEQREFAPAYRRRKLHERNGFPEWILHHDQPILTANRGAMERFARAYQISHIPEEFVSWLGVPMRASGKTIGVIALRSTLAEDLFDPSHCDLLQTIANQAAITIENARQYEEARITSRYNEALFDASQAISRAGLQQADVLDTIVTQAVRQTVCHLGVLYLRQQDALQLAVCHPSHYTQNLPTVITPADGTIVARALLKNEAQLVCDIATDPDYVDVCNGKTRSQLAVLLRDDVRPNGTVIGVLSVEHTAVNGLTRRDRTFLIALSNLATVAIKNAERAKELDRSKVVALMGAWGADIMHDINRHIGQIRTKLYRLLLEDGYPAALTEDLRAIDTLAESMRIPELPGDIVNGERAPNPRTAFDTVLRSEVIQYRTEAMHHANFQLIFQGGCPGIQVKIHEWWLRRLIRHYLNNAVRHQHSASARPIVVSTECVGDQAIVYVENDGPPVSDAILPLLFSAAVPHNAETSGRGLLIVRLICEVHHGRVWLARNEAGAPIKFAFSIPIES